MTGSVRVEPIGVVFELDDGETLMAAAERAGYAWPTICRGNAQCNRCWVRVLDPTGVDHPGAGELAGLRAVRWRGRQDDPTERLACRLTVADGARAVVDKRGVRPSDARRYDPP